MAFIIIFCHGSESTSLVKKHTWRTFLYGWASDPYKGKWHENMINPLRRDITAQRVLSRQT
ncbi:Uncharacterised protein [Yersinia massiliensis]|uniref:hypothetical protein n=1 Tax=Yersinia massiliensis TaxID=419257 RepID=UPI0005DD0946|nr:hypothetical protein [Yersinia massiliensis]CNI55903.1 Uncharacterised protein [Yersinia massiliensis]